MSGLFINVITSVMRAISSKPTDYLLKCTNLEEAYEELPLENEEVWCSLEYIRSNIEDLSKENILDELNNEFLGKGIMFLDYTGKYGNIKINYPKEGIICGEYIPSKRMIYVYIDNAFIDNFINKQYDLLTNAIIATCIHEDTHKQQIQFSNGKAKGLDPKVNLGSYIGTKQYLENPTEIDAHARETARYLFDLDYDGAKICEMINRGDPALLSSPAYKKYWENFGIATKLKKDKDALQRLKVWRRFLSRIVAYLVTTLRYKFSVNYDKPFKNLTNIENQIKNKA